MKKALFLFSILVISCTLLAQKPTYKKAPSIGLHFFYNDFATAQQIEANSLKFVLNNNLWSKPHTMQGGFGVDYLQGITNNIDAIGTFNASWVNYLQPGAVPYGSSNFMLDVNAGAHIKLLSDKYIFNPFLITKVGYLSYKNINGFNAQPGAGLQVNLFKEAFILTTIEYRVPFSNSLSPQLYYSIGIATDFLKKKNKPIDGDKDGDGIKDSKDKCVDVPGVAKYNGCPIPDRDGDGTNDDIDKCPDTPGPADNNGCPKKEIKLEKNLEVTVKDEATGQPLPNVLVVVNGPAGAKFEGSTDASGRVTFNSISSAEYTISGMLNNINTNTQTINKGSFEQGGNAVSVSLLHNDPRFTLIGNVLNKTTNEPEAGVGVSITNDSKSSIENKRSQPGDGSFRTQLEAASDFTIVAKKANYLSNIEKLSTKGLNRSTTLYVKLELGIEDASAGNNIVLNAIYFEVNKANVNTRSSTDLYKLVQFLNDNPTVILEIQGHTDNTGNITANNKLSLQRATSVVQFLIQNGIKKERLVAKGYGPTQPIASNASEEGRAKNRRVEMKVQ